MARFTNYTDAELVLHCDNSMNNLTTTDLEKELCVRLDALLQERKENKPLLEVLDQHEYHDAKTLDAELTAFKAVEQVLNDNGMSQDAPALIKELDRLEQIREALAN